MAEETFTFYKTKYFWKFINRQFRLDNLNDIYLENENEGDYTFLLAEQVPSNIYDCIDEETGCLDETNDSLVLLDLQDVYSELNGLEVPYFKLKTNWINDGESGFTIEMDSGDDSSVQIQVGDEDDILLQGIFLVKREGTEDGENFVLAYATISRPIIIRNFITVPYNGVVCGVGYCARRD